ncbi:MAG: phosphotransferase [Synergistaceae bacterium]|nr:phosphotransferase [Synergistaceae bacterium]
MKQILAQIADSDYKFNNKFNNDYVFDSDDMPDTVGDLSKDDIEKFIRSSNIFPADAELKVINLSGQEAGRAEGFVNLVFRVQDLNSNKSVIVKHVTSYTRARREATGERNKPYIGRFNFEVRAVILMREIFKDIAPEIYLINKDLRLIVMEDIGHLETLRFALSDGKTFPNYGLTLGGFLAGLRFYTSEFYLGSNEARRSERYFNCDITKTSMVNLYFGKDCVLFTDNYKIYEPEAWEVQRRLAANFNLKRAMLALGMKSYNNECMCHNDLTAGNIMIDDKEFRIIDFEFAGYGPAFMDLGKMTGSFILNYVSWLGLPDVPLDKKLAMQKYCLNMLCDLYNGYLYALNNLFAKYKGTVKGLGIQNESPERLYKHVFYDALRLGILSAAPRLPDFWTKTWDIAQIKDKKDLGHVQRRFLEIAEYVLINCEKFDKIEDFCELVHCCAGVDVQ